MRELSLPTFCGCAQPSTIHFYISIKYRWPNKEEIPRSTAKSKVQPVNDYGRINHNAGTGKKPCSGP